MKISIFLSFIFMGLMGCSTTNNKPNSRVPSSEKQPLTVEFISHEPIGGTKLRITPWKDGVVVVTWLNPPNSIEFQNPGCISQVTAEYPPKGMADAPTKITLTPEMYMDWGGMPEPGAPSNAFLFMKNKSGDFKRVTYMIPGKKIDEIDNGFNMRATSTPCN